MTSALALIGLPILARLLPRAGPGEWRTRVDLPLLVALSVGVAWVSADWVARFHLAGSPLTTSDFSQYCEAVDAAAAGRVSMNAQRSSFVAGLVAPLVAQHGVMDALVIGAVAGLSAVVAGIYLWAHAVGGRTAAIAAALLVPTVGPLVLLGRNPSFYAEQHGIFALVSGTAAMALVTRRTGWILLAAAAAAIAPCFDQRGVFWTVIGAAMVTLAAVLPPLSTPPDPARPPEVAGPPAGSNGGRRAAARIAVQLVLIAGLLTAGWWSARPVWQKGGGLEPQVYAFVETVTQNHHLRTRPGEPFVRPVPVCSAQEPFRWGWSSPLDLPRALGCMRDQMARVPADATAGAGFYDGWRYDVAPWFPLLGAASLMVIVGLSRRPWALLGLLLPLVPVLGAVEVARLEPDVRRLATLGLAVPVLLGVAVAVAAEVGRGEARRWGWVSRPVLAGVLILVTLGIVPSWLGPLADWRLPAAAQDEWERVLSGDGNDASFDLACKRATDADVARGLPKWGKAAERWR